MLTQRLGSATEKDPVFIEGLLRVIRENPGSCDEVWLASDYGFPKLETHRDTVQILSGVAEKFKKAGIRVSLQISNTIGHGEYMRREDCSGLVYESSPVEKMVGPDGTSADYCFCWNGENFRNYTGAMLREYAKLKPYCVWFDDDLRAPNHRPVPVGCFCDDCIQKFNARYGCDFSREELIGNIHFGDLVWRERYVQFLRDGLYDFTYFMAKTVHDISPDTYMGLQYAAQGGHTGFNSAFLFDALYKASGKPPKTRPGGGAYSGHDPNEFLHKAFFINWQNATLPEYVTEMRPEIENLPDVVFGKSIANTCFETSLYLANGNTAMSYAMLMNDFEPMNWHGQMLHRFAEQKPYWKRLIEANQNTHQGGLKIAYSENMWKRPAREGELFSWAKEPYLSGYEMWNTAIPICYGEGDDGVFLLHPDQLEGFSDEDIENLLKKPVVTDGKCLEMLQERGFGDALSASAVLIETSRLSERYNGHPINRSITGNGKWVTAFVRDAYSHMLIDRDGSTEPFGIYQTEAKTGGESISGQIANAVVTTKNGAKWAVFGHYLWNGIISLDKRNQILYAADYIGNRAIPAVLESPMQAVLLPRENEEGRVTSVSVVNTTVGETGPLALRIRRPAGKALTFMSQNSQEVALTYSKQGDDFIVEMPSLSAWSVGTVFVK